MPQFPDRLGANVDHALDLAPEGITLYRRQGPAPWAEVGHAPLQVGTLGKNLERLAGVVRGLGVDGPAEVQVWLPQEEIITRRVDGAPDMEAIRSAFATSTAHRADQLVFDPAAGGNADPKLVAAVPVAVLQESRDFVAPYGFTITQFTTREAPDGLAAPPVFRQAGAEVRPFTKYLLAGTAAAAVVLLAVGAGFGVSRLTFDTTPRLDPVTEVRQIALAPDNGPALPVAISDLDTVAPQPPDAALAAPARLATTPDVDPKSAPLALALVAMDDAPDVAPDAVSVLAEFRDLRPRLMLPRPVDVREMAEGPKIFTAPIQTRIVPSLGEIDLAAESLALELGRDQILPARFDPAAIASLARDGAAPATTAPPVAPRAWVVAAGLGDSTTETFDIAPRLPARTDATTSVARLISLSTSPDLADPPDAETSPPSGAEAQTASREFRGEVVTPNRVRVIYRAPDTTPPPRPVLTLAPQVAETGEPPETYVTEKRVRVSRRAPDIIPGSRPESLALAIIDEPSLATDADTSDTEYVTAGRVRVSARLPSPVPPSRATVDLAGLPAEPTPITETVTESRVRVVQDAPAVVPPSRETDVAPPVSFVSRGENPRVVVLAALPVVVPPPRSGVRVAAATPADRLIDQITGEDRLLVEAPNPAAEDISALVLRAQEEALEPSPDAIRRQSAPPARPNSIATAWQRAEEERLAALAPTERALLSSTPPVNRPSGLPVPAPDLRRISVAPTVATAPSTERRSRRAAPQIPTTASVARAATIDNALPLRQMTLLGVFGKSGNRHALMRLPSGRTVKVSNGDTIDGYTVAAISADAIRIRRRGRDTVLVIPE